MLWPFFCRGYFSGSAVPYTRILPACISTFWPLPIDSTSLPVTAMQAPVEISLKDSSGVNVAISQTIWILLMVEPSFRAMNVMFLLPLLVLTHPLASTSLPGVSLRSSAIFCLWSVIISCVLLSCLEFYAHCFAYFYGDFRIVHSS